MTMTFDYASLRASLAQICGHLLLAVVLTSSWTVNAQPADGQKTFESPQAAAAALADALEQEGSVLTSSLFDKEFQDQLVGGDEVAAQVDGERLRDAVKDTYRVRQDSDERAVMLIGPKHWPLPFPIVKSGDQWYFDTAAGIQEVQHRRIGRNELNAISVARIFVTAQHEYASADRDGDQVLEYAQRIGSRPGQRDGLYWEAGPGEPLSPFGPLVADARDYGYGRDPGDPYFGYYFRVLTRQGLNPPGGRYDYVINGNMIGGFGLLAFPADYDNSGIKTFMVNQQGQVYEKDLGEITEFIAGVISEYNPDETWDLVEE